MTRRTLLLLLSAAGLALAGCSQIHSHGDSLPGAADYASTDLSAPPSHGGNRVFLGDDVSRKPR